MSSFFSFLAVGLPPSLNGRNAVTSGRAFIKKNRYEKYKLFLCFYCFVLNIKLIIPVMKSNIIVFLRGYRFGPPFCAASNTRIEQQLPSLGKPG